MGQQARQTVVVPAELVAGSFDATGEVAEALCDVEVDIGTGEVLQAHDLDHDTTLDRTAFLTTATPGEEARLVALANDRATSAAGW